MKNMAQAVKLNTGDLMPAIGFGTWQLHEQEAYQAVLAAFKAGYRYIDTARIYGNEAAVGRAARASGLPRSELFITTKLWNDDNGYQQAHQAFAASLRRLALDYVDLYLIHWPFSDERLDSWQALTEIHQRGLAKAVGVSNYTIKHLEEVMVHSRLVPAVNQIELHPFIYASQRQLLTFCRRHKIAVQAYSPLAHGRRMDNPLINEIAARHGKTPAQVMVRWCVQHGTVPIPKSTNPRRIAENFTVFDFDLSPAEMRRLDDLSEGLHTTWDIDGID